MKYKASKMLNDTHIHSSNIQSRLFLLIARGFVYRPYIHLSLLFSVAHPNLCSLTNVRIVLSRCRPLIEHTWYVPKSRHVICSIFGVDLHSSQLWDLSCYTMAMRWIWEYSHFLWAFLTPSIITAYFRNAFQTCSMFIENNCNTNNNSSAITTTRGTKMVKYEKKRKNQQQQHPKWIHFKLRIV